MNERILSYNQVGDGANYAPWLASEREAMRNAKVKIYPDKYRVTVCTRAVYKMPGYELSAPNINSFWDVHAEDSEAAYIETERQGKLLNDGLIDAANAKRAQQRARVAVYDLASCTPDLTHFITLTLSKETVNRYDPQTIIPKLNTWLHNRVSRQGLTYIIVPELHKDGAIHFHGLINDALKLVDSGTLTKGSGRPKRPRSSKERDRLIVDGWHPVYNIPDWKYGFTTAIELYGQREAAVRYVVKYIGKATTTSCGADCDGLVHNHKIGGRYYYSGGNLQRPTTLYYNFDLDAIPPDAYAYSVPQTGDTFYTYDILTSE